LNVNAAISAMSVPVGPHGSFEVAVRTYQHILPI
jgi:hypothetical protein